MKNIFLTTICLIIISGCCTLESVGREYQKINFSDGVNKNEASIIARKNLFESNYSKYFTDPGHVRWYGPAASYPDYWFVEYGRSPYLYSRYYIYLVVIQKNDGKIIFSDPIDKPDRRLEVKWIFKNRAIE